MNKNICLLLFLLSTFSLEAQNHFDVLGDAYIQNRLTLSPGDPNGGEYIVNNDGFSLSFYTAYEERLRIENDGRLRLLIITTDFATTFNLVVAADGSIGRRNFSVGDEAHGGIVFYVDDSGEHGLVCMEEDLGGLHKYMTASTFIGATANGLGSGLKNTVIHLPYLTGDSAARECSMAELNGYSDWYLPSRDELSLLYTVFGTDGAGNFDDGIYWSSNEVDFNNARGINFDTGNSEVLPKETLNLVRPIRSF